MSEAFGNEDCVQRGVICRERVRGVCKRAEDYVKTRVKEISGKSCFNINVKNVGTDINIANVKSLSNFSERIICRLY
jgi:hypothetical protein